MDRDADTQIFEQYSRVLSPEALTSRFWFQLNKGFQREKLPVSMDVIAQANIILSHQVNDNMAKYFDRLKADYEEGNVPNEYLLGQIASLREISTLPENVSQETIAEIEGLAEKDVMAWLHDKELERENQLKMKQEIEYIEKENILLREQKSDALRRAEEEIAASIEKDNIIKEQSAAVEQLRKELLSANKEKKLLEEEKEEKENREKKKRMFLYKVILIVSGLFILFGIIIMIMTNYDFFGVIATVVGFLTVVISFFKKLWKRASKEFDRDL